MSQFFDYTGVVEDVLPVQTFSTSFTFSYICFSNSIK